jgi:hypothetical protein
MNTKEIFISPEAEILKAFYNGVYLTKEDVAQISYLDTEDSGVDEDGHTMMGLKIKNEVKKLEPVEIRAYTSSEIPSISDVLNTVIRERLTKFYNVIPDHTFECEEVTIEKIGLKINLVSNLLAAKTRRGPANLMIVNAMLGGLISEMKNFEFSNISKRLNTNGLPYQTGILNGNIRVVVDPLMKFDDTKILLARIAGTEEPGYSFVVKEHEIEVKKRIETTITTETFEFTTTTKQSTREVSYYEIDMAFLAVGNVQDTFAVINISYEKLLQLI